MFDSIGRVDTLKGMTKKLTLERLAELTHQELLSLGKRADDGFKRMDQGFQVMSDEFDRVRSALREIKLTRDLISRAVAGELAELRARLFRVEKKIGLTR